MKTWLHRYRFELLLIALAMAIFNKIIFTDNAFYTAFIWPFNMLFLGIASLGVFHERKMWEKISRNLLFLVVISVPVMPKFFFSIQQLAAYRIYRLHLFLLIPVLFGDAPDHPKIRSV